MLPACPDASAGTVRSAHRCTWTRARTWSVSSWRSAAQERCVCRRSCSTSGRPPTRRSMTEPENEARLRPPPGNGKRLISHTRATRRVAVHATRRRTRRRRRAGTHGGNAMAPTFRDPAERSGYLRLFYRDWRPTRLGRLVNGVWAWLSGRGLTPRILLTLQVKGRRSGRLRISVLVVA